MEIFAHNGIDHATTADAVAHSANDIILTTIAITLAAALILSAVAYGLHKLGWITIPTKDKEK